MSELVVLQFFCSSALTGLIWTIQLVHYPMFALVAPDQFANFHARHSRQITWIVFPLMSAELLSAIALAYFVWTPFWFVILALTISTWIFTGTLSVPLHQRLEKARDLAAISRLIGTNWFRTAAWSLKSVLLFWSLCH